MSRSQARATPRSERLPSEDVPNVKDSRGNEAQETLNKLARFVREVDDRMHFEVDERKNDQLKLKGNRNKITQKQVKQFAKDATVGNKEWELKIEGGVKGSYTFSWIDVLKHRKTASREL
ncbi:hypothetical protein BPOR_1436g00010 [Botrytis porri]|uniref:Uncharacterized protein n=1 Tax=Botrytis porri TaxID=87229 RepID=A0A4Z1KBU3_9HELO|nr:hypothetical protein BPOR_1436g00010 [Botrytis porri]